MLPNYSTRPFFGGPKKQVQSPGFFSRAILSKICSFQKIVQIRWKNFAILNLQFIEEKIEELLEKEI